VWAFGALWVDFGASEWEGYVMFKWFRRDKAVEAKPEGETPEPKPVRADEEITVRILPPSITEAAQAEHPPAEALAEVSPAEPVAADVAVEPAAVAEAPSPRPMSLRERLAARAR
jgi:hypothetical protein